jgi:hypothetical protein
MSLLLPDKSPSSTVTTTAGEEDELLPVRSIARRASARAPRSPSLSSSLSERSSTPEDVYWLG